MQKRMRVYYDGRVQGVGFRFTAENLAGGLGLGGWVKNLRDGRVEVVAEGEDAALEEFLARIREYFSRYIAGEDIEWQQPTGEFKSFGIEF